MLSPGGWWGPPQGEGFNVQLNQDLPRTLHPLPSLDLGSRSGGQGQDPAPLADSDPPRELRLSHRVPSVGSQPHRELAVLA